jgi:T3SS negative regulator,GrlR
MLMAARFRPARIVRHLSAPYGARIASVDSFWGLKLQKGLYKVEFHTVHGTGSGVIYVVNGKLRGGNSAFAFIGNYADKSDGIHVKISTQRHNPDPAFKPLFGTDMITLTLKGTANGDMVDFEGTALQLPGVTFKAVLTRISD